MMLVQFIVLCLIGWIPKIISGYSSGANFEGDMNLTPEQLKIMSGDSESLRNVRLGFLDPIKYWPDGNVRYHISEELVKGGKMSWIFPRLFTMINCVTFSVRGPNDTDYILFVKSDDGCSAPLGYHKGVNEIKLDFNKCGGGDMLHVILHALGLLHMHNSQVRNKYINILWQNIKREDWVHFNIYSDVIASLFATDYDYFSIMHLPKDAYSKNGEDTIFAFNMTSSIGQRLFLSCGDSHRLNVMYQCF